MSKRKPKIVINLPKTDTTPVSNPLDLRRLDQDHELRMARESNEAKRVHAQGVLYREIEIEKENTRRHELSSAIVNRIANDKIFDKVLQRRKEEEALKAKQQKQILKDAHERANQKQIQVQDELDSVKQEKAYNAYLKRKKDEEDALDLYRSLKEERRQKLLSTIVMTVGAVVVSIIVAITVLSV